MVKNLARIQSIQQTDLSDKKSTINCHSFASSFLKCLFLYKPSIDLEIVPTLSLPYAIPLDSPPGLTTWGNTRERFSTSSLGRWIKVWSSMDLAYLRYLWLLSHPWDRVSHSDQETRGALKHNTSSVSQRLAQLLIPSLATIWCLHQGRVSRKEEGDRSHCLEVTIGARI